MNMNKSDRFPDAKNNNVVMGLIVMSLITCLVTFVSTILMTINCDGNGVSFAWAAFIPTAGALLGVVATAGRGTIVHYRETWKPMLAVSLTLSIIYSSITEGCGGYGVFQRAIFIVVAVADAALIFYLASHADNFMGKLLQSGYTAAHKYNEAVRGPQNPYANRTNGLSPYVSSANTAASPSPAPAKAVTTQQQAPASTTVVTVAAAAAAAPTATPTKAPISAATVQPTPLDAAPLSIAHYKARALYTYDANEADPNELSFKKNEILEIVDSKGKWWQARKEDGTFGIAPSNYLELMIT